MPKILVIEDNSTMQSLLSDILEAEGFQAVCTNNGRMGLAIVQQYHPDLILSDIHMPEMDGYAVLEALRQDLKTATIPIIFLTAEASEIRRFQSQQLDADDWLSKPVNPAALIASIQKQLAKQVVSDIPSSVTNPSEVATCPL
jgi:CheY-like chemotaxis protein